jgi:hypothetical protein
MSYREQREEYDRQVEFLRNLPPERSTPVDGAVRLISFAAGILVLILMVALVAQLAAGWF